MYGPTFGSEPDGVKYPKINLTELFPDGAPKGVPEVLPLFDEDTFYEITQTRCNNRDEMCNQCIPNYDDH